MSDKLASENFYSSNKDFEEVDFGKIFRFLLMQSKLIILFSFIVFLLSYINYSFSTKEYLIKSLLQYDSFDQNVLDPSKSLQMGSTRNLADISSLTELYESRTNFLKVINDLKLNINIEGLKNDEFVDIEISSDKKNEFLSHEFKISISETGYSLLNENFEEIQTSEYGKEIYYNDLRLSVNSASLKEYRSVNVTFKHPESLYNSLKSRIDVKPVSANNPFFLNEGLITVSLITDDVDLGKSILNYANNIFLNQRIYVETEKSRKAINFIDKNIKSLEGVVKANKIKLKEFREKNKSIDVSLEIEAIVNKIQSLEQSLRSIDLEIAEAQQLYTSSNPIYLNLLQNKKLFERQKENVLSEIEMMPKEQQDYIDLYNDVEVSQSLFQELESRRLGFKILEASTIGDIRIVDNAYVAYLVSPKITSVFVYTFMSFVIACFIAIIRGFNFLPLSNPAEIFDNNIHLPVIGVIPDVDDMTLSKDNLRLNTAIESLIVNINSIQDNQPNKNIITVTSPSPFNGKSTISMKLAEGFAKVDKKVLLVDNDLKRGKIARNYNIGSISEKTFNEINHETINNYLVYDNLYIIPRVKGLNNTFQFLYSYQYKEKIKFFRESFDYIIFDTGPILSVADSSVLIEQSDINLLIVRHGINRMNEIKQTIDNFKQINTDIDGIIYNAYAKPNSYYGYYGIYGNYSYQYYADKYLDQAYEYEKKD